MEDIVLDELKMDKNSEEVPANLPVLEEMSKAGLFLGHQKSKTHPRMRPFIFTTRNGLEIIDLSKTLQALERAMDFIKSKVAGGGSVLLVGTTPAAKLATEETAKKINFPYVTERWLGGTLTNFKTLSKRVSYFKKLRADRQAGKFDKYTKKEQLNIDREIAKLTLKFSGVENMEVLPQLLFVVDVSAHNAAIREAKRMNIPVVGIINTDADPAMVDYPIPANDRSKAGLEWIFAKLETAVNEAKLLKVEKVENSK
jgi:small subunit ribosomal protein S2